MLMQIVCKALGTLQSYLDHFNCVTIKTSCDNVVYFKASLLLYNTIGTSIVSPEIVSPASFQISLLTQ